MLRETGLAPGVPLDPAKLDEAQVQLGGLGAFQRVDLLTLKDLSGQEKEPWQRGDLALRLQARDGLAAINGSNLLTAMSAIHIYDMERFLKQAEICAQYLKKGRKVLVEGRLTADPATGSPRVFSRQDGSMGSSFEISASTVRFLSSRDEQGGTGEFNNEAQSGATIPDDIPF